MLITNVRIAGGSEDGGFFVQSGKDWFSLDQDGRILLFKGHLYPDAGRRLQDLIKDLADSGAAGLRPYKGRHCGAVIDKENASVKIFTDQLGLLDLYYYFEDNCLIVSDRFSEILDLRRFLKDDLDAVAMAEFLLCEHVLGDRTFVKKIKVLRYATLLSFNCRRNELKMCRYYRHTFDSNRRFNREIAFGDIDDLLKQSIRRIHFVNQGKKFAIGLSGGYDSRIAAKYALDEGMELKAFVYDHRESDAWHIAKKLARKLEVPLTRAETQGDYLRHKERHLSWDPMHSIRYAAYYEARGAMPDADCLLNGFLGGELFGNHIRPWDSSGSIGLLEKLKRRILLRSEESLIGKDIRDAIEEDLRGYQGIQPEDWKCCEVFELENRQSRFIKNSPNFWFYGDYEGYYSIFADIDLVEYVHTFPFEELAGKKFYFDFHARYLRDLASIRGERLAGAITDPEYMKTIKSWLLDTKMRVYRRSGIKLPVFRTINYLGHFDWEELFSYCRFEDEYRDVEVGGIYSETVRKLPNYGGIDIKFNYLTLQYFIERFIGS